MFSLVIPTFNRAPILKRTLDHLLALPGIAACEIIVVNDGSTDETASVLEQAVQAAPSILKVFTIANGGPARARNHGVRAASNARILFVDDDVFPRPGMLESHWKKLDSGFTGSQGLLIWHQDIVMTPLIEYIDSRGSQFAFDRVTDPENLTFQYIYTGNFAVERAAVLKAGGFDESFFNRQLKFSAFEDTILGWGLQQNGARMALNRDAIADHLHDMTEEGFFRREYKVGYSIGKLRQKYPAIAQALGLEKKDFLAGAQAGVLRLVNSTPVKNLMGYSLRMRLRHREAFYRGFLQFKREAANSRIEATQ
jgi:glycosyltransferase involved in cell wall biosynthesis